MKTNIVGDLTILVIAIILAALMGFHYGDRSNDLDAYMEGQQACMDWYGIDPYAEEAEVHGL